MIAKKILGICAIISVFYLASCLKDEFVEVDGVCPVVISTIPVNGAIDVPLDQIISVTFNEEMNPATITSASLIITGATAIAGVITYQGTTATFTPSSPLTENTSYTGKVTTKVKDKTGNALQTDYVWTFSTGSILNPLVITTDPANLEGNVNLNKIITATFNMPMDALSINANTFTITLGNAIVPGSISYSGTTTSFDPTNDLLPNTTYTGTITTGAKNPAGVSLAANYVWTFTTGTTMAPMVISTDPTNNAVDVALNKIVTATFSEAMNPATITNTSFTLRQGATLLAGTVTYSGVTATFTPSAPFLPATLYTGTISKSVKNPAGVSITADYIWTFTTESGTTPIVISTDPANNETNVAINKTISATFSEVMNPATINGTSFLLRQGATVIAGTISYSGTTAYFNPSSNLTSGTTYTATITTGAKNFDGTSLVNNYVWSFTTGTVLAPFVISTDPANNETNVALGKTITATFSVPMDPTTINASTFTLKSGTTIISGNVTYSGTTASFDPTVNLISGANYTATITTGATDVAGTHMAASYTWTFSTGAVIAPTVISTDPLNNATGVSLSKTVTATFSMPMDPLTINNFTFLLKNGNTLISGTVTYSGTTASFNPTINLLPGTTFTATITSGVENVAGTPMSQDYVWSFTTVAAVPPTVISTDPANNESAVSIAKTVTATFSEPMDPSTINGTTFTLRDGNNVVNGNVSYSGVTASFDPTGNLLPGTTYIGTITTGARNLAGTSITQNYVWSFTTAAAVPPTVISTDPANNATGVNMDKTVTATFSVPMDPSTINNSTFTLKNGANSVTGVITYSGSTASFNPSADLLPNTTYTGTITTGAQNLAGTALAQNYVWTFTTAAAAVPPTVISTDPANNATGVSVDKTVTATFSVPMDPSTINATTFTLKNGANSVTGVVTYSGTTASLNPTANLLPSTTYTGTITTGAKNVVGTPLAQNYVWTFTTAAAVPPTVISTDPLNNATGVSVDKTVTATFSVPMDPLTINATTFTLKNGAVSISGVVSYSGTTASFNPTLNLLASTTYTATITTGAKNVAGTPLAANYVWSFTIAAAIPPPTVTSTDPVNNASNVFIDKTVTANFSVPMDPNTINSNTFTLKNGANAVTGVVSYSGQTASFNPSGDLLTNTVYTASITTGAKSAAGIPLANDYTWTFTTAFPPGAPLVDLGTVARFGIIAGVGISNNSGISQIINMDVGISPGVRSSVTGFPPAIVVNGAIYCSDDVAPPGVAAMLILAKQDLTDAYNFAAGASNPPPVTVSGDQGGLTLAPGIYKSTSTLSVLNGNLTLDAQGNPNAVWIFQIASALTTVGGAGGSIILSGGAKASNIFWQIGSSATIGGSTIFKGNILALTSITMNTAAVAEGRMLCINGAVVLTGTNIITKP